MLRRLSRYWQDLFGRAGASEAAAGGAAPAIEPYTPSNVISTIGTVVFHKKGSFYGIITDSGTEYLPFNFAEFNHGRQSGMRVRFTAELHPQVASVFQWGTPIRLISLSEALT